MATGAKTISPAALLCRMQIIEDRMRQPARKSYPTNTGSAMFRLHREMYWQEMRMRGANIYEYVAMAEAYAILEFAYESCKAQYGRECDEARRLGEIRLREIYPDSGWTT